MNCKRIICSLTFLDKPELTCLHTVILGAFLADVRMENTPVYILIGGRVFFRKFNICLGSIILNSLFMLSAL